MDGKEIRKLREARGLSQAKLATAAGITQPMLSMIENGAASPSLDTLQRLASALGLRLDITLSEPAATPAA